MAIGGSSRQSAAAGLRDADFEHSHLLLRGALRCYSTLPPHSLLSATSISFASALGASHFSPLSLIDGRVADADCFARLERCAAASATPHHNASHGR